MRISIPQYNRWSRNQKLLPFMINSNVIGMENTNLDLVFYKHNAGSSNYYYHPSFSVNKLISTFNGELWYSKKFSLVKMSAGKYYVCKNLLFRENGDCLAIGIHINDEVKGYVRINSNLVLNRSEKMFIKKLNREVVYTDTIWKDVALQPKLPKFNSLSSRKKFINDFIEQYNSGKN